MASNLQSSTFLAAVAHEVKQHYATLGREPHSHARSRLAQFWWGPLSALHYEVAIHERNLQLEIGLHFEAAERTNRDLFQAFSRRLLEIQEELGDSIWVEEWDRGWTRIYETEPLLPLDEARVISVASRLCEIMDCLQPILESVK